MNYKHLSQVERYQIYSLMKAQHGPTQIAKLLGRGKSTITRELRRNAGVRGYRPKQACRVALKLAAMPAPGHHRSTVAPWIRAQANALLQLQ